MKLKTQSRNVQANPKHRVTHQAAQPRLQGIRGL